MRFVKSLVGGIAIMMVATLVGVAQNARRSKPMTLFPKLPKQIVARPADGEQPTLGTQTDSMDKTHPAVQTGAPQVMNSEYAAGKLTKERVQELTSTGAIVLIDAREEHEFEEGHLPGAINIPYDHFVDYYDQLLEMVPMDADVVTYCRSLTCDLSDDLAREMQLAGYERVLVYKGGWLEWTEAEMPVEGANE